MDLEQDCVAHMKSLDAEMPLETARAYLGRFGLSGELATKPVKFLSGGQKSRLAFAELAWKQPHIMLLDEPTNHLDLETIEALAMALNNFEKGRAGVARRAAHLAGASWMRFGKSRRATCWRRRRSRGDVRVRPLVRGVQGEAAQGVRGRVAADEQEETGKGGEGGAREGGDAPSRRRRRKKGTRAVPARGRRHAGAPRRAPRLPRAWRSPPRRA